MANIIILPPGPAPVQKTASYRPKNLEEQLAAFLNSNNPNGFAQEIPDTVECKIPPPLVYPEKTRKVVDILIDVSNRHLVTLERLKAYAKELKKCSGRRDGEAKDIYKANSTRFGLPLRSALDIVAKVLGYNSFKNAAGSVVRLNPEQGFNKLVILNKRKTGEFKEEFFPDNKE